ncbi:MAG: glycosyltransferase family 39 protein [Anaerolineae bacterium]
MAKWFGALGAVLIVGLAALLRLEVIDQFPPGLSRDEAQAIVLPYMSAVSGVFPLFETEEPEPLHRALLTLLFPLTGGEVAASRTVQALIGVATVAASYWAAWQWLAQLPPPARYLGAFVAAGTLAVALGHITLSRSLYRGLLQVPLMLGMLGFLARGLHIGRWRDFALCGLFAALAILSYTAAYVLPAAFAVLGAALLIRQPRQWRRWLPRLSVVAVVAGVVLLPMLWRMATVPESIFGRTGAVAAGSVDWGRTTQGMLDQLFLAGDENPQYNVAEAPVIPPLAQPLFLLGVGALLLQIGRPVTWFLLALLVLASLPAMLSDELTHGLRVVGWFALFPLVSAWGAAQAVAWWPTRWQRAIAAGAAIVFVGLVGWQGISARETYQHFWRSADEYRLWRVFGTELNHNEWFFRTDIPALFARIAAQNQPTLLPFDYVDELHPRAWALRHFPQTAVWPVDQPLPRGARMVFPALPATRPIDRDTRQYVLLYDQTLYALPQLAPFDLPAQPLDVIEGFGRFERLADVYMLPEGVGFAPMRMIPPLRFGDDLELVGWAGERDLAAGRWQGTLYWRVLRPIGHDYLSFVQVLTQDYERLGGADVLMGGWPLPPTLWQIGQVYPQPVAFELPALDAGAYRLVVGVYPSFGRPVTVFAADEQPLSAPVTVDWLRVPVMTPPLAAGRPAAAVFDERITLRAYAVTRAESGVWRIQLEWQALSDLDGLDVTVFVHLLDEGGGIIAQRDERPLNGSYPTLVWRAGESVVTEYTLSADNAAALRVGLYTLPEVRNLPVTLNGAPSAEAFVVLPLE